MIKLFRRLRYWLERGRRDAELAEEIEFHRSQLARDGGSSAEMGNTTLAREDARAVWIWPWLESLWQDATYGVRTLRRQPGFTIAALLALASAIGINTSLFTIFNAFALRPWPVRDRAHMVTVHRFTREGGGDFGIAEYRYLAANSQAFSGLIAMRNGEQVKIEGRPLQLTYASGNYFRVLGVEMERGRGFLDEEDRAGTPEPVAVISHYLWQNVFGGDASIVGRSIRVDDIAVNVVGVAPADFNGTSGPPYAIRNDIWVPLSTRMLLRPNDPSVESWLTSPGSCCTPMAGRLGPGATRARAQAELAILLDQFRTANRVEGGRANVIVAGTSWIEGPRKKRQVIPMMAVMFLAVTLVLLLACANVGNLLLARAAARRQEIAVRLSLGGSRLRLIRQLLVESMMLAAAAAGGGLATAFAVPSAVVRYLAGDLVVRIVPDGAVLALFDVQNVTMVSIDMPASQYTGPRTKSLARDLLAGLERVPDFPASGLALSAPLGNSTWSTDFRLSADKSARSLRVSFNEVSGGYFDALRIRILAGRNFVPEDAGRDVVIFNQSAARRWWPGENPVGKTILSNDKMREIVGVAADAYTGDISSIAPVMYFPMAGDRGVPVVLVHDRGAASVERIAGVVKQIEPRAQVRAQPLAANFRRWIQPSIYGAELAGFLGLLALTMASVGMSGVFAYVVGQRTREIGVRMALGARPAQIVRLVLGSSLGALAYGLAAGVVCAVAISMLLVHALPGVKASEPLVYPIVVLLLGAAVALASAVPARRATRVDPVRALRWE